MLFSRNTWIFVQFVLWMGYCMSYFHLHVLVWMISCLFVSYDKFLAMWLVSEFFRSSKVEIVSTFFSPRLLLSNWYYCVIWCISGEKSRLVENRLKAFKSGIYFFYRKKLKYFNGFKNQFLSFMTKVNSNNGSKTKSDRSPWDICKSYVIYFFIKKYGSISMIFKIKFSQFYDWREPKQYKWNKIRHFFTGHIQIWHHVSLFTKC